MLKNYFKTALRSLWREKTSTLINFGGLTAGITSTLLLFLLVNHHSHYDQYHSKSARVYRIVTNSETNGEKNYTPGVPPPLPDAFRNDFPEAEEVTFLSNRSGSLVTIPQGGSSPKKFQEDKGVAYAQSNFFRIFDRRIVAGDAEKGLNDPGQAIISIRSAKKYFGKEDVVGEVLRYDDREFRITAIMQNFPAVTDFPFDLLLSYSTIKNEWEKQGWGSIWSDDQCYFLLADKVSIAEVENRLPAFHKKYHKEGEDREHQAFVPQSLQEIHFDERYGNYNYNTVSRATLTALQVIAAFLLITASVNFINLTTAEAVKRSREVGIRKALGSSRHQLIQQFLGETALVTVVSVLASLVCTELCLTLLNPFLDMSLSMDLFHNYTLWIFLLATTAGVSLLSGLYPSLVISGFEVTRALKNQLAMKDSSGFSLRRVLVVLQFVISQTFIIGTIVLIQQMNYFRSKELGFRKDAIITIPLPDSEATANRSTKLRTLREEVLRMTGVQNASLSNTPPSSSSTSNTTFEMDGSDISYRTQIKAIDSRYLDIYGLQLVAGTNVLDLDTAQGFLVNERLAELTGNSPQDMLGRKMKMWGQVLPVVGVVHDFHTVSLREPISPTAMFNIARNYQVLSVQLSPTSWQPAIKNIQSKWEAVFPSSVFSYEFLDDQIREFYEQEAKLSVLLTVFTGMAILIGCLGLFGLATFMANQKTKEIGVRKVLGATVESIVGLFSREYLKLILMGFVVAAPLSGFIMQLWLNEFAYKIKIGPMVFLVGIGTTLLIAMITVGYRSFQAAIVNPAQSLKSE